MRTRFVPWRDRPSWRPSTALCDQTKTKSNHVEGRRPDAEEPTPRRRALRDANGIVASCVFVCTLFLGSQRRTRKQTGNNTRQISDYGCRSVNRRVVRERSFAPNVGLHDQVGHPGRRRLAPRGALVVQDEHLLLANLRHKVKVLLETKRAIQRFLCRT